jgi:spoIIIJ-associated protein
MKIHEYTAKTIEEAKEKALEELNVKEIDIYTKEEEEAGGLFKGKKAKLQVITKDDVISYCKEFITDVTKLMGINVNMEAKKRDTYIKINMFSDNNPILIGKMGKTIEALQILIKSSIQNTTGFHVSVILDVEDYKEKQQKNLEYNVKKIAYEVKRTGVEAKLDPMNSFERRIVHNVCNELGGVYTESTGEEPNRFVTIKKGEE